MNAGWSANAPVVLLTRSTKMTQETKTKLLNDAKEKMLRTSALWIKAAQTEMACASKAHRRTDRSSATLREISYQKPAKKSERKLDIF